MVLDSQGEYDSQWAAIYSIAPKIGCTLDPRSPHTYLIFHPGS